MMHHCSCPFAKGVTMNERNLTVILFSGGLDSTTLLMQALHDDLNPVALSLDYGQRNVVELEHARRIAEVLQVPWTSLNLTQLTPAFATSPLIALSDEELARDRTEHDIETDYTAYVP